MINEDDLADADLTAKEPRLRFRFIEKLAIERLRERDPDGVPLFDDYDYMGAVLAAAAAFGISDLTKWDMPSRFSDDWLTVCRNFRGAASRISQQILFEYASRPANDRSSVALEPAIKERLRFHLGQVRSVIDEEPIDDWRKQPVYEAIAKLEAEFDKARTHISAVLELVAKAFEGSVAIPDALRQIVVIVQDAAAKQKEVAKLTPPEQPKQLAGPAPIRVPAKKGAKKGGSFTGRLDDDIPF